MVDADRGSARAGSDSTNVVVDRRRFHSWPELGWCEFVTTGILVSELLKLGWDVTWGRALYGGVERLGLPAGQALEECYRLAIAERPDLEEVIAPMRGGFTGCVAKMARGGSGGRSLAYRFDIDGLPVSEAEGESHRPARFGFGSRRPGIMHACGHDAHAAVGLSVAREFARADSTWAGIVTLVFQPAEEGTRGGEALAAAGAVDGVELLLCWHIGCEAKRSGTVVPGVAGFLATCKLDLAFRGVSAHAALSPDCGRNALLAASMATLAIHGLPAYDSGVTRVNVGVLHGGLARNVVAPIATCEVEVRAEAEQSLQDLCERIRAVAVGCAEAQGVSVEIETVGRAGSARSDPAAIAIVEREMKHVRFWRPVPMNRVTHGSDDATSLMRRVQSEGGIATYAMVGSDLPAGHHTGEFDLDEAVLAPASDLLFGSGMSFLGGK